MITWRDLSLYAKVNSVATIIIFGLIIIEIIQQLIRSISQPHIEFTFGVSFIAFLSLIIFFNITMWITTYITYSYNKKVKSVPIKIIFSVVGSFFIFLILGIVLGYILALIIYLLPGNVDIGMGLIGIGMNALFYTVLVSFILTMFDIILEKRPS